MTQTVYLENSSIKKLWVPIQFFLNSGRELDRLPGKLIQSSIRGFWGMTQAVLLENSSKRKHLVENNILRILGRDTGRITGKLIQTIFQYFLNNSSHESVIVKLET